MQIVNPLEYCLSHDRPNVDIVAVVGDDNITHSQMKCLSPTMWLTSAVINPYLYLLQKRNNFNSDRAAHILDKFFYDRVLNTRESDLLKWSKRWLLLWNK